MKKTSLFTSIKSEGGLLSSQFLEKLSQGSTDIEGIRPEDYHLQANERINEVITKWTRLLGTWINFRDQINKLPQSDTGISITREKWLLVLFQELGYGRLVYSKPVVIDERTYHISHFWNNTPVHLASFKNDLDRRIKNLQGKTEPGPHSLLQEFLNKSKSHLWGFVSNGYQLRILRDNSSLTRQFYIEFDLEEMMENEIYPDFSLLWLICHESRVESDKPENCWLEKWAQKAQTQGVRALDDLRSGVEKAIRILGQSFIEYRGNTDLALELQTDKLDKQDYYRELLRLVYRLIFLFAAEDRDILLLPDISKKVKENYLKYYSTKRIRKIAERIKGTNHIDLYISLKTVMSKLYIDNGGTELGIPALGSFLWSNKTIPHLENADISNRNFLDAVRTLAFTEANKRLLPVDFKNLGSEEFGSIYESLLELHPEIDINSKHFELKISAGHERKTTASYYTPSVLINPLLDSALEPVLDEAVKKRILKR